MFEISQLIRRVIDMLQEAIFENYGIVMGRQEATGTYLRFFSNNTLYTIIPVQEVDETELMERLKLSVFMHTQGDFYVSKFILTRNNTYLAEDDDQLFILLENSVLEQARPSQMGYKLAKFHIRGKSFNEPITACSRIGKWKELWEGRIDYIEALWRDKVQTHPANEFEKLFVESFPYYLGLAENAIQYLVDCEIDDDPSEIDTGTVCHERFYTTNWIGKYLVKNPFDWVFDHHSRDLGEWVREHQRLFPTTYQPEMVDFLREYNYYSPISGFSWKLIYARLLFPVRYIEIIERYFENKKVDRQKEAEDELVSFLQKSHHYEEFLRYFFTVNEIPIARLGISKVDWL